MTLEDFDKIEQLADEAMKEHPEWRKGQAFFNVLYTLFPDVANEIRGSSVDMFYDSSKINEFKTMLEDGMIGTHPPEQ